MTNLLICHVAILCNCKEDLGPLRIRRDLFVEVLVNLRFAPADKNDRKENVDKSSKNTSDYVAGL